MYAIHWFLIQSRNILQWTVGSKVGSKVTTVGSKVTT